MVADTGYADLELSLRAAGGGAYAAEVRARLAGDAADTHREGRVRLAPEALPAPGPDPRAYGAALAAMLFADPRLREAVAAARGKAAAAGAPLRVRLRLAAGAEELHGLAWETLLDPGALDDPERAGFWFAGERVLLSRYLDSPDPGGDERRPPGALRALVAVAAPTDAATFGLDPVDAPAEVERATAALGGIAIAVLGRGAARPPASLAGVAAALRAGPDVLYLVCHGSSPQGRPVLWLERADGTGERVAGEELARALEGLPRRPALVVLASCESAGRTHDPRALAALGPRLALAGVGAVVAMQGEVTQATAGRFLSTFFGELQRDGLIDRAAAAARAPLTRDRPDWWAPVLFLRLRDGRLWAAPAGPRVVALADERGRRNRQRMLARVRRAWIEGVLEASLQGAALQALGLEERPEAVPDRRGLDVQEAPRLLPPGTSVVEVFKRYDGELLLLGEPGAGKTTLLLVLASELLARAEGDETLPIPVVLPLSTWAARRPPLAEWLVGELVERYEIPRAVAAAWVADERILPLLDGLDEVRAEHRAACVGAINAFRASQRTDLPSLAVCCRTGDYETLGTRLRLWGAVQLQPLTPEQVEAYVASAGPQLAALRAALRQDAVLVELAASPLLLSLMALTYHGAPAEALPVGGSAGDRRTRLFAAYVDRMLDRRRPPDERFTKEQTLRWLGWLANALPRRSQTVFYLERLQPEWLPTRAHRGWYTLLDRAGFGLLFGVLGGWIGWLLSQQVVRIVASQPSGPQVTGDHFSVHYGLAVFLVATAGISLMGGLHDEVSSYQGTLRSILFSIMLGCLIGGTTFGVVYGINFQHGDEFLGNFTRAFWMYGSLTGALYGLLGGLVGVAGTPPRRVVLAESLRRSASRTAVSIAIGAFIGLLGWVVYGSLRPPIAAAIGGPGQQALAALLFGPAGALLGSVVIGLLFGVLFGLSGSEVPDQSKMTPNQGIHRSVRRATTVGLTTGVVVGALSGVGYGLSQGGGNAHSGLLYGLGVGAVFAVTGALVSGGYACLSHLAMRIVLWRANALPLDTTRFLDYAAERVLLRKVGGGYLFFHRLLQEHLASREDAGRPAAPRPPAGGRPREPSPS